MHWYLSYDNRNVNTIGGGKTGGLPWATRTIVWTERERTHHFGNTQRFTGSVSWVGSWGIEIENQEACDGGYGEGKYVESIPVPTG